MAGIGRTFPRTAGPFIPRTADNIAFIVSGDGHRILLDDKVYMEIYMRSNSITLSPRGYPILDRNNLHHYVIPPRYPGPSRSYAIEYINGDKLDNRRCNLRRCTINMQLILPVLDKRRRHSRSRRH